MMRFVTILILAGLCLVAMTHPLSAQTATVTGGVVNLRSGPGTHYAVVGQATRGERLEVGGARGDWLEVRWAPGQTAWIAAWLVELPAAPRQVEVTAHVVNLRAGPGTGSPIVGQVTAGQLLSVQGEEGDWLQVETAPGSVAYIAGWLTRPVGAAGAPPEPAEPPPQIVSITARAVNLRAAPSTAAAIVGHAQQGDGFPLREKQGDWYQIDLPGGGSAFVAVWLANVTAAPVTAPTPAMIAITGSVVNLRSGASTSFAVVGQARQGETFLVLATQGDWLKVALPDGTHAFVATRLTAATEAVDATWFAVARPTLHGTTHTATVVRSAPATSFSQMAQLTAHQTVEVLTSAAGWHQVALANGATGWIEGSLLALSEGDSPNRGLDYQLHHRLVEVTQRALVQVTGSVVNLRTGPSTSHAVRTTVLAHTTLEVLGNSPDWLHVRTPAGQTGWIAGWLIAPTHVPDLSRVSWTVTDEQTKTLTIEGQFSAPPSIYWLEDGKTLAVLTRAQAIPTMLDVNQHELKDISLNENGIMLRFYARPQAEVLERTASRVTIAFGASVPQVELLQEAGRDIVRVHTLGHVVPDVVHDAQGRLTITLPRTRYTGPLPPMPSGGEMARGLNLTESAQALRLLVDSAAQGRYIVRSYSNHVDVELLKPGLAGKVIMLDPGHGGKDPGAIGPAGLFEKTVNLDLALRLQPLLEAQGAMVHLTRTTDTQVSMPTQWQPERVDPFLPRTNDLAARSVVAQLAQADLFISMHNNGSHDPAMAGTTTFYHPTNLNSDASKQLAQRLHQALLTLGRRDRGVRTMNLAVLRTTTQPAVLLEVVYITNAEEEALLRRGDFLDRAAQAVLAGLQAYFAP